MTNEIKINVPEGMEIDRENSTFECIKFKKKLSLPKTWEEFCKTHTIGRDECYINHNSRIIITECNEQRLADKDRNILSNKETAEAFLALMQLVQLRDCYNDGWKPDWEDNTPKYVIYNYAGCAYCTVSVIVHSALAFKTEKLRDQFLENFRELIEIAKLLI